MITYAISPHYSCLYNGVFSRAKIANLLLARTKHMTLFTQTSLVRYTSSSVGSTIFRVCELPQCHSYFSNSLSRFLSLKAATTPASTTVQLTLTPLRLFCSSKKTFLETRTSNRNHPLSTSPEGQHQRRIDHSSLLVSTRGLVTMAGNESPTASSVHMKHYSTPCSGATVSDSEVQLMNDAREIFQQAVHSVLPYHLVKNKLNISKNDTVLKVDDVEYLLQQNVYVIGFGKAVIGMARSVEDSLGQHIVKGVISVPTGIQQSFKDEGKLDMLTKPDSRIVVMEGAAGNLPDEASHKAALEVMKIAEEVKADDILIVLISGGGSALLPSPKPPVTLEDMLSLTKLMSRSGASIIQLNTVRKEIEILKGGGLVRIAQPARVISLILSDVIGDPLDFIAGGPTVKDTSATGDSLGALKELNILSLIPSSVSKLLNEEHSERCTDAVDWSRVQNVLVGSNRTACDAACARSAALEYLPCLLSTKVEGDAKEVGRMYISLARYICLYLQRSAQTAEAASDLENVLISKFGIDRDKLKQLQELAQKAVTLDKKGVCVVAGGETTVIVLGKGIGGRNQEMAVSAALELNATLQSSLETKGTNSLATPEVKIAFLAAGTDGMDGPNPAAGGVVTACFNAAVIASGLDASEFLSRNDTYTLLSKVGAGLFHVVTGQTGTNVMDIHVLLVTKT